MNVDCFPITLFSSGTQQIPEHSLSSLGAHCQGLSYLLMVCPDGWASLAGMGWAREPQPLSLTSPHRLLAEILSPSEKDWAHPSQASELLSTEGKCGQERVDLRN
jgi:hypothetical protein